MAKEIIHIDDIGDVVINRDKRFRRLSLKMNTKGEIKVTSPQNISIKEACQFIISHKSKIEAWAKKITKEQRVFDENSNFSTFAHTLKISRYEGKNARMKIVGTELRIVIPNHIDIHKQEVQTIIKKCLTHTLKTEGKAYLPQRALTLAAKHNFEIGQITVKEIRSRWGSCSMKKNINLSCFLMLLTEELIDFVILHELCHTKQMNHSAAFHSLMNKVTDGKEQMLNKTLRMHHIWL